MTIKTKLILSTILQLSLVAIVGVSILVFSFDIKRTSYKDNQSTAVVETMSQLRFVTFEHLKYHHERSFEQWQAKQDDILPLLDSMPSLTPEEDQIIGIIRQQHNDITSIFHRLTNSFSEPASEQASPIFRDFQDSLTNQLLTKQQSQISQALRLSQIEKTKLASLQQLSNWLLMLAIALMFAITVTNYVLIAMGVNRALAILQRGADKIASGEFDFKIRASGQNNEIGRLAGAFNTMAASLRQLDQMKTEFVMLASHQLRTPATAVKGFISMLLDDYAGQLSGDQKKLISAAYEENERQIRLINNILDAAKVEAGEMQILPKLADLGELIDTAVNRLQPALAINNQRLVFDRPKQPVLTMVDTEKFRMVIDNLVDNASKYSAPNTVTTIRLSQQDQTAYIEIQDEGEGIAKQDTDKLFKRFSRINTPRTTQAGGSGLGLYLVKQIVDLHKGKVSVKAGVSKGTSFIIELPIKIEGTG